MCQESNFGGYSNQPTTENKARILCSMWNEQRVGLRLRLMVWNVSERDGIDNSTNAPMDNNRRGEEIYLLLLLRKNILWIYDFKWTKRRRSDFLRNLTNIYRIIPFYMILLARTLEAAAWMWTNRLVHLYTEWWVVSLHHLKSVRCAIIICPLFRAEKFKCSHIFNSS